MNKSLRLIIPAILLLLGIVLILSQMARLRGAAVAQPTPTRTPEPLLPTKTAEPNPPTSTSVEATSTPVPTDTPAPSATAESESAASATIAETSVPTNTPVPTPYPDSALINSPEFARFGISGPIDTVLPAWEAGLRFNHTLDWLSHETPAVPETVTFWQMLRLSEEGFLKEWGEILPAVQANRGATWIIGNEPDVIWQDNVTAETYARLYHEAYTTIKRIDSTARIAPAGVAAGTLLRLEYLDRVRATYLAEYETEFPADVWTVHAFNLREERGSWGVDIPPGFTVDYGEVLEIEDHGSLEIFRQNLVNFRAWMAENGYQDTELAVTELGILFPSDYGFPHEVVVAYMEDVFEELMTLENETGMPSDNNRLVQLWFWYILEDPPDYYPTGNLFNSSTNDITPLGEAYIDYITRAR